MTKKKRKRRKSLVENIRRRLAAQNPEPARASDYIYHLQELIDLGIDLPVILCGRVSTRKQDNDGSLKRQAFRLRKTVEEMGAKNIIDEPLMEVSLGKVNRSGLESIISLAKELGAIPVFETTDRIIRAKDFCPKTNPTAISTVEDFEELMRIADGVQFATVLHPDADYREIKSYQSKYEEKKKDRVLYDKSKPGWRKKRRKEYRRKVLKMKKSGMSHNQIAEQLNLPISLVRYWWLKHRMRIGI